MNIKFSFEVSEMCRCEECGVISSKPYYYRGRKLCRECYEHEIELDTEDKQEQEEAELEMMEMEDWFLVGSDEA